MSCWGDSLDRLGGLQGKQEKPQRWVQLDGKSSLLTGHLSEAQRMATGPFIWLMNSVFSGI